MVLIERGCAGDGEFSAVLGKLYDELKGYCTSHSVPLHMTGLTRALLSFPRDSAYPSGPTGLTEVFLFVGLYLIATPKS